MKLTLLLSTLVISGMLSAQAIPLAKTQYQKYPAPPKGGTFNDVIIVNPKTLNPMLIDILDDREIADWIYQPLMSRDGDSYEQYGVLAEKVDSSKDNKDYTFTLNSKAKWSDGTPVTSDDMEFTFQKIMDPKVEASPIRSYLGGVTFQKIDNLKFKFHVDNPRYNTLNMLGGLYPIQKKQFEKESDFNKSKENLHPIGCGPYKLKSISRDQAVILERDSNWWAKDLPDFRARNNFEQIQFKVVQDPALRYEHFIKGNLDTINFSADQFTLQVRGTDSDKIGTKANSGKPVWADRFPSDGSLPWFGLALNQTNPILKSVKARQAIAFLFDYDTIIEKAFFKTVEQCLTPFGSRTKNLDPKASAKRYKLDPKKAAELLKQDGWANTGTDNLLHKTIDGKDTAFKIQIKFYASNQPLKKTGEILREQFKKSGIELELRPMDGTALYKDFDDKNFDAMFMGWGGGSIYPDPRQNWHTDSIASGSNKVGYSNPAVDKLIEKANMEFDMKKRAKMLQEIGRHLYEEVPYVFMVERSFILQGLNSRIKSPKWVEKYGTTLSKDLFFF